MTGGKYCYPETDVLINKYDIKEKDLLEKFEIQKVIIKIMSLDITPQRVAYTYDVEHLVKIHQYLFGDIYDWAGKFRQENLYKEERVLSGGSAEYADYLEIEERLETLLHRYDHVSWKHEEELYLVITDFLLDLWSIHPFREGNTRSCITFIWHYLRGRGVDFQVSLLRNNPMYVRDSLVMANYDEKEYLRKIIRDALTWNNNVLVFSGSEKNYAESYKITKEDYIAFRNKYSIK